jgi:probable HAF family extracellular repeat protein
MTVRTRTKPGARSIHAQRSRATGSFSQSKVLKLSTWITVVLLVALPAQLVAQSTRYKLIDLGTLGGPNSVFEGPPAVTNAGSAVGESDTLIADPYAPNCLQSTCLVNHTFSWKNGVLTDLGALPGVNSSIPFDANSRGQTVGGSENSVIDPLTGFPEFRAVLWQQGKVIDLGTFGGNNALAASINNRGQVVGGALNAIPDEFAFCSQPFTHFYSTQVHAFSWENGVMQDLGTLGGLDSCAFFVNERGQVAGISYTNSTPNPGTTVPTQDPFLWQNGKMTDLGSLGGTLGFPNWLNNRGQVVGSSNVAGDLSFHPFLWDGGKMSDLGTVGGNFGNATLINDAGNVVGWATPTGDQVIHAFRWSHGLMTDLGTLASDLCSIANAINSKGQIVGLSSDCGAVDHAFLWQNGGPIVDLSLLVLPGSDVTLFDAVTINDRGEIGGLGTLPDGDSHAVLLIPCDGNHADTEGCSNATDAATTVIQGNASSVTQTSTSETQGRLTPEMLAALRIRFTGRYRHVGAWPRH